ncbi:hypothetical protein CcaverHIS002_0705380 [Cutaneotrichosporon cavernicola]|uniref:Uncharacterized protein n=1 Tax=Cutaneotrichosporon cavernicola TaxID=279322 RepID=A0AA48LAH3_9TREE|nr:uncharacterized protein CcaverHIS019_0705430 [Cutaneotrichosporon cavernicola]BEI87192.1 hypothetical protein CcaverHIS002_0705380 [Cutaneotrichosporon cavernicola]BEI94962.1 hypothetical protein CcaverHIS019_0705430 [Cutaneotrichosporon cavernicola]BEJ02736.1 hypothetical protein CcaverHIS631_0705310 [Cutaneotrichosporon cavernicola]
MSLIKRRASTMVLETARMSVLHGPLQPLTRPGDTSHPTGFYRDGYCWGSSDDPGRHYVGAVMSKAFLEFSKDRGNDLSSRRPGFRGLTEGCKWCLCVERWKEALVASETLGRHIVPRVDLAATALDTLRDMSIDDLEQFAYDPASSEPEAEGPRSPFSSGSGGTGSRGDNIRRNGS